MDHIVVLIFHFLRNLHTYFHSGCTSMHSHQQCMRVAYYPYPHWHLMLCVFLMTAILTGVRWNLKVVIIWNPLWPGLLSMSSCIYWFFCTSSFGKFLFSSFAYLITGSLILWEFTFLSVLCILVNYPLSTSKGFFFPFCGLPL
jgi:hypothetical protein